ncbi:MAG: beta-galactosidase, partial [Candidatus Acidiferrales bacterium]
LLQMIQKKGFRLIARPGPVILNEWRHGGYPEWLLERTEYGMDAADRLEGRYPPFANLNARNAEEAAQACLDNPTHMTYTHKWLARIAAELAPYSVRRTHQREIPAEKRGRPPQIEDASGPLLFVQLDDDLAIGRANYAGPAFWRYVGELRGSLAAGGLDVPAFINPFDPRVAAAGAALAQPVGVMGQWYLRAEAKPRTEDALPRTLGASDASAIEYLTESLKTQPAFPPMMIEYNAAWYTPYDDPRPTEIPRENTLLSSRLLIAQGLAGINHFPVQDTLAPAGYEVPWSNRHFRWDAALDLNAARQPRARAVERTGQLLAMWGEWLGGSHERADFGIVNPTGAFAQEKLARADVVAVSAAVARLMRLGTAAGLTSELLDAHHQPVEQLLRHPLLLLPVFAQAEDKFRLSEQAQRALVEYVRAGGVLVTFPERPAGAVLQELWGGRRMAGDDEGSVISTIWQFGKGTVIESSKDFYSWANPNERLEVTRARMEAAWATRALRELLGRAGARPAVEIAGDAPGAEELLVTTRVSNEGTGRLGNRNDGRGLLSVVNLAAEGTAEAKLQILSPRQGAKVTDAVRIELPVSVPAGEAVLLPLHYSLCSEAKPADKCDDELIAAGGELLSITRDGKSLELLLYAPARATLVFRFAQQPRRVRVDELGVDGVWTTETRNFQFEILRGAAPYYLRSARIDLRHTPFLPEKPDEDERRRDYDYAVTSATRLPLASDAGLATEPPLVLLDDESKGSMVVEGRNYDEMGTRISVKVEGPVRASELLALEGGETGYERLELKPERDGNGPPSGEVLTGEMRLKGFGEERAGPVKFVRIAKQGVTAYRFDFDRDGAEEWVLEDAHLRAIVSPEAGGRAVALVSKTTGLSLTTSVGALRDHFAFAENPPGRRPERARGAAGLFNRAYTAEWVKEEDSAALRMSVQAPDVYPAGARVEKTVRLRPVKADVAADPPQATERERDAKDEPQAEAAAEFGALEVNYRVSLAAAAAGGEVKPQSFVAVQSIPVLLRGERTTRFCWTLPAAPSTEGAHTTAVQREPNERCERFAPGASMAAQGVTRMRIHTPGSNGMLLEWSAGTMSIEMKNYSALLKITFPPLTPGGAAGEYKLRFEAREID